MKLAEALNERADLQKRFAQLRIRLNQSARIQEGDTPPEAPEVLLQELNRIARNLELLIQRINRTNSQTLLRDGMTISDAIVVRDTLRLRADAYRGLAEAAAVTTNRYSRSEIRTVSTVSPAEMQRQADDISQQYRELDTAIQAMNWNTDLVE